jgi:aspartyl/asparaginyl-tRNA synthetase
MRLYSIYDRRVHKFEPPMAFENDVQAERFLQNVVNNPNSKAAVTQYPQDFELYYVGEHNSIDGTVTNAEVKILTAEGIKLCQEK